MELKQMYQMHGNFNPLPRKEGDYNIDDVNETYSISIRSLVKRETLCAAQKLLILDVFQSAPS